MIIIEDKAHQDKMETERNMEYMLERLKDNTEA